MPAARSSAAEITVWMARPPIVTSAAFPDSWREVPGRAYEAGGGGAAWSEDWGESWRPADDGRDRHYTWSVAVDREDPALWYLSASTGPFAAHRGGDPQAHLYRRRDGSWEALAGGLPDPLPAMPYALAVGDDRLFAGLANGEIWESRDKGDSWRRLTARYDVPSQKCNGEAKPGPEGLDSLVALAFAG